MEVRLVDNGKSKLKTLVYFAPEDGFSVASVIVFGEKEAVLIDTQWRRSDAYRVAALISELGRELTHIFVTHAHPDHYFGTAYIAEQFPGARCIAPKDCYKMIYDQFYDKIDHWTQVIGKLNVCTKRVELEPLNDDKVIMIEGERIEIFTERMGDVKYNSLVWIPSIKTVYGSDILFSESHPFTCEVTKAERQKWLEDLDFIESLKPEVIIPGHAKPGMPFNNCSVDFTRAYLHATEEVLETTKTAGEFFLEMCRRFPKANLVMLSNEMNAQVFKGHREWNWRDDNVDPTTGL